MLFNEAFKILRVLEEWHRYIARQNVIQRRNVGRSLNGSVPAQGQDAAAGTADVPQQQLEDRRGSYDLNALGVLRPTQGVANGASLVWARRGSKSLRHLQENIFRNAAAAFHHLGRVAPEVPLQNLENATRMLKCRIRLEFACIL